LNWVVKTDQNWCKVGPYAGSVATGGNATLTVFASPPSKNGPSVCTVTVLDNNADNSPQTITVNYAVSATLNR
jgi:hypothetical protein